MKRICVLAALVAMAGCGGDGEPGRDAPVPDAPAQAASGGEQLYQQRCVSCHQVDGRGTAGVFPPLAASEFANASNIEVPVRVLLHGMMGPITVHGQRFEGSMPPYGLGVEMSDDEVAAVLTYVRASWGNSAAAVTSEDVARIRVAPRARTGPVTEDELRALM